MLTWMVEVLRAAGVPVVEHPGWQSRSAPGSFSPRAVMWHHDASAAGPSPGMPRMIAEQGNAATPPPLAHAWVATDGTWHLTAAGRANHAGTGSGWGVIPKNAGNTYAIGIETDHTTGEAWPAAQLDSLRRGTAALLKRLGASPSNALCGHREYAPGRKVDPDGLDMNAERRIVAEIMEGADMNLQDVQERCYRAVLDAINEMNYRRGDVQSEARDSLVRMVADGLAAGAVPTVEIDYDLLAQKVATNIVEAVARMIRAGRDS